MRNRKINRMAVALALAAVAALGSGCGQQAYYENEDDGTGGALGNNGGGTGNTGGTGAPSWTPTITTNTSNAQPSQTFHFQVTGTGTAKQIGGSAMTVTADAKLQIAARAGVGGQLSGFTIGFNCEMFNIKVGSVTKTAFVKKAQYTNFMLMYGYMSYDPCQSAVTTWNGDFSSALGVGTGPKTITISNTYYDNCRLYKNTYDGGCGLSAVYSTHTVDGFIDVFTDTD